MIMVSWTITLRQPEVFGISPSVNLTWIKASPIARFNSKYENGGVRRGEAIKVLHWYWCSDIRYVGPQCVTPFKAARGSERNARKGLLCGALGNILIWLGEWRWRSCSRLHRHDFTTDSLLIRDVVRAMSHRPRCGISPVDLFTLTTNRTPL